MQEVHIGILNSPNLNCLWNLTVMIGIWVFMYQKVPRKTIPLDSYAWEGLTVSFVEDKE